MLTVVKSFSVVTARAALRASCAKKGMTDLDIIPVETCAGLLKLEPIDATRYARGYGGSLVSSPLQIPLQADSRQDRNTSIESRGAGNQL